MGGMREGKGCADEEVGGWRRQTGGCQSSSGEQKEPWSEEDMNETSEDGKVKQLNKV